MNNWIKANPGRDKSQLYICPYCNGAVYQAYKKTAGGQCEYRYCPHCRREVVTASESTKNGEI